VDFAQVAIAVAGVLMLCLAVFHSAFHRLFNWRDDFSKLSVVNVRIVFAIHIALALVFAIFGVLTLAYSAEISRAEGLARAYAFAWAVFWGWRAVWQIVGFKPPPASAPLSRRLMYWILLVVLVMLALCFLFPLFNM